MPERKYSVGDGYRYGFNGKENDNEVKGVEGSQQDYGMRIYDPRLGRWLSMDPIFKANESPYVGFTNNPIIVTDPDGQDGIVTITRNENGKGGTITLKTTVHLTSENAAAQAAEANKFFNDNKSKFSQTLTEKLSSGEEATWKVNFEINFVVAGNQKAIPGDGSMTIRDPDAYADASTRPPASPDDEFNRANKKSLNGEKRYKTGNSSDIFGEKSWRETNQFKITMIHEALHQLGLSDRYDPYNSAKVDEGFKNTNDIMTPLSSDNNFTVGKVHFQNLLNFALKESKRLEELKGKDQAVDPNKFVIKHRIDLNGSGGKVGTTPGG